MLDLRKWACENNCAIAWGDGVYLNLAYEEFAAKSSSNNLNELQNAVFKGWDFTNETGMTIATVILVAVSAKSKTKEIVFDFAGKQISVLMPPFYDDYAVEEAFDGLISSSLREYFEEYGYRIKSLSGPMKNLAARIGLGKYGRNNLIYVDGLGSFVRLMGFVTDAKLSPEAYPGAPDGLVMKSCEKCDLCRRRCPSKAIPEDGFQLQVDHCLAYLNEKNEDWPEKIHNIKQRFLVGCLDCQWVCPQNKDHTKIGSSVSASFDEEETGFILGDDRNPRAQTVESTYAKLAAAGLSRYKDYIVRNIRVYVKNANV